MHHISEEDCRTDTRDKFAKHKFPFWRQTWGKMPFPSLWNSLPELIKKQIINTFKHNVKN